MSHRNIILIGPMGSGKSTIGKIIARRLHREFQDSDHFIERRTGVDIARIFDVEGEHGFRDRESNALIELLGDNDRVIATGGGSVLRSENQQLLKQKGYIVFLDTSLNPCYKPKTRARVSNRCCWSAVPFTSTWPISW